MTASSSGPGGVPPLHLVTDDETLRRPDFPALAEAALREGGAAVALHLRSPGSGARALLDLLERLAPAAAAAGARLLVNDRVDLAMAVGADGVQLGSRAMPISDARKLLGPGALIGASVHSLGEGGRAAREGADFLLAGTLFETPSHPARWGSGTAWLADLARLGPPVVGIGGITPERAREVRAAGAAGVAAIRGVWASPRPTESVRAYLQALDPTRKMNDSIRVTVNGEPREIPAGLSIQDLLEHLSLQPRLVVVEHNGDILRRESYPATSVASGDSLELVHFVGGG